MLVPALRIAIPVQRIKLRFVPRRPSPAFFTSAATPTIVKKRRIRLEIGVEDSELDVLPDWVFAGKKPGRERLTQDDEVVAGVSFRFGESRTFEDWNLQNAKIVGRDGARDDRAAASRHMRWPANNKNFGVAHASVPACSIRRKGVTHTHSGDARQAAKSCLNAKIDVDISVWVSLPIERNMHGDNVPSSHPEALLLKIGKTPEKKA